MIKAIYGTEVETIHGQTMDLENYRGKVILVVNTASGCGFRHQLGGFQKLYNRYKSEGFVVLGFPCNQFGAQEPGSHAQIQAFCHKEFAITFPLHAKIKVNGEHAHPLFGHLKQAAPGLMGAEAIKWNFTKFLIDRTGLVVKRFSPRVEPEALASKIEELLAISDSIPILKTTFT